MPKESKTYKNMPKKSTSGLSADEWADSYRTALKFLKELFQYEGSRSTGIKRTEGSTGTLPGK